MTTCTTCAQIINEVVTIDGLPYGTTCAQNKLGIRQFPSWFKGGDWNRAKKQHDADQARWAAAHTAAEKITADCWEEWTLLSRAHLRLRRASNDWAVEFVSSIIDQLGYYMVLTENWTGYATMEEAKKKYNATVHATFPYMFQAPRKIADLSPKQRTLLKKYI